MAYTDVLKLAADDTIVSAPTKWEGRFLRLAREVASWSKDPSTKVGAVITAPNHTILAVGFNGFPRGTNDDPNLYAFRPAKYARVVHAELNAVLSANRSVQGATIYVWPFQPCSTCMGALIQAGIARVVTIRPTQDVVARWEISMQESMMLAREAGVQLVIHHPANMELPSDNSVESLPDEIQ